MKHWKINYFPIQKVELNVEFDKDENLILRKGGDDGEGNNYKLIILRLQLFVPRLTFNAEGQKLYMETYLKPYKWTYLNETLRGQITPRKRQVISESLMVFQKQDMFLYLW